jgi:hypothetical protein
MIKMTIEHYPRQTRRQITPRYTTPLLHSTMEKFLVLLSCPHVQRRSLAITASLAQSSGGKLMGQNRELRWSNSKATSYKVEVGPSTRTTLQPTFIPECGLMSTIFWSVANFIGDSSIPPCAFTTDVNACTWTHLPSGMLTRRITTTCRGTLWLLRGFKDLDRFMNFSS